MLRDAFCLVQNPEQRRENNRNDTQPPYSPGMSYAIFPLPNNGNGHEDEDRRQNSLCEPKAIPKSAFKICGIVVRLTMEWAETILEERI